MDADCKLTAAQGCHAETFKLGAAAGIDPSIIILLIQTFGPALAQLIMHWIKKRKDEGVEVDVTDLTKLKAGSFSDLGSFGLAFILDALVRNRDEMARKAGEAAEALVKNAIDSLVASLK